MWTKQKILKNVHVKVTKSGGGKGGPAKRTGHQFPLVPLKRGRGDPRSVRERGPQKCAGQRGGEKEANEGRGRRTRGGKEFSKNT